MVCKRKKEELYTGLHLMKMETGYDKCLRWFQLVGEFTELSAYFSKKKRGDY